MHHLEMPQALAGAGIERQQTVAEEIGAAAVGAVKVVLRARRGGVNDTALFVDREFAPDIRSADALPGILRPRIIPEFAGARNGVEGPHQLPCYDIERDRKSTRLNSSH